MKQNETLKYEMTIKDLICEEKEIAKKKTIRIIISDVPSRNGFFIQLFSTNETIDFIKLNIEIKNENKELKYQKFGYINNNLSLIFGITYFDLISCDIKDDKKFNILINVDFSKEFYDIPDVIGNFITEEVKKLKIFQFKYFLLKYNSFKNDIIENFIPHLQDPESFPLSFVHFPQERFNVNNNIRTRTFDHKKAYISSSKANFLNGVEIQKNQYIIGQDNNKEFLYYYDENLYYFQFYESYEGFLLNCLQLPKYYIFDESKNFFFDFEKNNFETFKTEKLTLEKFYEYLQLDYHFYEIDYQKAIYSKESTNIFFHDLKYLFISKGSISIEFFEGDKNNNPGTLIGISYEKNTNNYVQYLPNNREKTILFISLDNIVFPYKHLPFVHDFWKDEIESNHKNQFSEISDIEKKIQGSKLIFKSFK